MVGLAVDRPHAAGLTELELEHGAGLGGGVRVLLQELTDRAEHVGAIRHGRGAGGLRGLDLGLRRGVRDLGIELDRGVGDHELVALGDLAAQHGAGFGDLPDLGDEGLAREHRVGEADLDALELLRVGAEGGEHVARGIAVGAQPVQDRLREAERAGEAGVDVQRVPVAREPVQQRLVVADLLRAREVGRAIGGRVGVARGPSVAAPAARAADHRAELVVGEHLAGLIGGLDGHHDERVLALVEDVLDPRAMREPGARRQRPLELGVLLTVQQAVEAVVEARGGLARAEGVHDAGQRRDHGVGRQGGEALAVHLVDVAQLVVVERVGGRADTERVEREVALVVRGLDRGELVAERLVDVDELVAALARPGVDVVHHDLERLRDVLRVRGLAEVDDRRPILGEHLRGDLATATKHLALGPLPAQLAEEAAADLE